MLHEVFGEKANPGVISVENYPLSCSFGLPNEVVFHECRRIQVHYHINEARNTASGKSLRRNTILSLSFQEKVLFVLCSLTVTVIIIQTFRNPIPENIFENSTKTICLMFKILNFFVFWKYTSILVEGDQISNVDREIQGVPNKMFISDSQS